MLKLGMLSFVLTLIFAFLGNITFSVAFVLMGYIRTLLL